MVSCVVFDFETGGVEPSHPNIQLAAAAVDHEWNIVETFERKILFDEKTADPESLRINHYDVAVWAKEAKPLVAVISGFDLFLNKYKTVSMVSKRTGRPYSVARLAGHNIIGFDIPRLKALYGNRFMPAHPIALDTIQLAIWHFHGKAQPQDYKLTSLLKALNIEFPDAHDALADVKATIALAKALCLQSQSPNGGK